ncbi:MAG: MFS transporter [Spirochaetota bacterium]
MSDYTLKGKPSTALFSTTWGFFIGFAAVVLFTPLVNALGLSPTEKGLLLAISSLTGSFLRIPFAAWVDTTGGRRPFVTLLLMSIIGMLGIYIILGNDAETIKSQYWVPLLICGGLAGCGIATFSVGIAQTSYWFPNKRQGWANGIFGGVGNLAPGIFVFLITNFLITRDESGRVLLSSVRTVYMEWLIFLIVGTIIYWFSTNNAWYFQYLRKGVSPEEAKKLAMENGQEKFPSGNVVQSLVNSAKIWQTWVLVFVYFLSFGGFLALTNWFKQLFQEYHAVDVGVAASLTALYSIGASIVRASVGGPLDKTNPRTVLSLTLVLTGLGALIIALTTGYSMHIVGLLCMTIGMGIVNAAVFKVMPQYIPHAMGGAAGWIGGLGAVGGFVLPITLSSFLSSGGQGDPGYPQGFWVYVGLSIASVLLVSLLKAPQEES